MKTFFVHNPNPKENPYTTYRYKFVIDGTTYAYIGHTLDLEKRCYAGQYYGTPFGDFIRKHSITTQDLRACVVYYFGQADEETKFYTQTQIDHPDWVLLNCPHRTCKSNTPEESLKNTYSLTAKFMTNKYRTNPEFKAYLKDYSKKVMALKQQFCKQAYGCSHKTASKRGLWNIHEYHAWLNTHTVG